MLINEFLLLGAALFCIGVYGVIARRNGIMVLMSIELILNSVNINLLAFALRNGDVNGNPATELEATWQPIDNTPMHPEYPCAHCIQSGAAVAVIESVLGSRDISEVSITSSTAPGVTHRWTNLDVFSEEIANARIWAGFHYRFSTRVGTDMGRQIGDYVVKSVMQSQPVTGSR